MVGHGFQVLSCHQERRFLCSAVITGKTGPWEHLGNPSQSVPIVPVVWGQMAAQPPGTTLLMSSVCQRERASNRQHKEGRDASRSKAQQTTLPKNHWQEQAAPGGPQLSFSKGPRCLPLILPGASPHGTPVLTSVSAESMLFAPTEVLVGLFVKT